MPLHALMPEGRLAARQLPGPSLFVFGRLKHGISREAAQSNLTPIVNDLAREYPATGAGFQVRITDIRSRVGTSEIRAFASAMLFLAGLVLLTACVSIATGLTARTMDRHREIGIRISLGAGRFRVMRLMLIEALVIAGVSGTIALGMVWWATRVLSQLSVPIDPPMQVDVHPDARVFLVATVVSILVSVVATVAPSRVIATLDPNHALKGLAGSISGRRWATRDLLTVAQVVFSCVLMAASILSIVGMRRALAMPLGFDADRVATVTLDFDVAKYTQEQQWLFMERAAHDVRRLPGVEGVAYVGGLPLGLLQSLISAFPEGRPPDVQPATPVAQYPITEDYFRTMGIRMVDGRDLSARDTDKAVVNEAFVRQILHSTPAIGTRVTLGNLSGGVSGQKKSVEIVGVVVDGKYISLAESSRAAIFTLLYDSPWGRPIMVVRASEPPSSMAATVRRSIANLDPTLPVRNVGSAEQLIAPAFLPNRAAAFTLTSFGVVALVLAMTGIHGVVSYAVSRRRWEIGVRVALGASRVRVISLVLGRIVVISGTGIALGVVSTVALARVLQQIVYLASSDEPMLLGMVTVTMLVVVAGALVGPTIRSLRIEPMIALRSE
jgi:predicted permease